MIEKFFWLTTGNQRYESDIRKKWSYIFVEDERGWILTFMLGGPVEIDISVLLNNEETKSIGKDLSKIEELVEQFKNNIDEISERRIARWNSFSVFRRSMLN